MRGDNEMLIDTALHDRLKELFLERLSLEVADAEADLLDAGLLDSLAFVELMLVLEERFGIPVSVDSLEIGNFRSIAKIGQFIVDHSSSSNVSCVG
jgi:acyl carrier protein